MWMHVVICKYTDKLKVETLRLELKVGKIERKDPC